MPYAQSRYLPDIADNERVCLVLRQHWFVLASRISFWVIFAALLLLADGMLKTGLPELAAGRYAAIATIIKSSLLILTLLGIFLSWTMYYLNVQIITNKRIIDIDQVSLLHHETNELHMQKVEDVTTNIKGPLANFLDYGNVTIQTAGEKENFVFENVLHPHDVAKIILDLYEKVAPISADKDQTPIPKDPPA